jgi:hypothetical protein
MFPKAANLTNFRADKTDTNCITSKIRSDGRGKKLSRCNYGNTVIKNDTNDIKPRK